MEWLVRMESLSVKREDEEGRKPSRKGKYVD